MVKDAKEAAEKIRQIQIKLLELSSLLDEGDYWMELNEAEEIETRLEEWTDHDDWFQDELEVDHQAFLPNGDRLVCLGCGCSEPGAHSESCSFHP